VWQGGDSAPIEHSWSVGVGRKLGPYNIVLLARLSAHTDWSAGFNWHRIVFYTTPPPLCLVLYLTLCTVPLRLNWLDLTIGGAYCVSSVILLLSYLGILQYIKRNHNVSSPISQISGDRPFKHTDFTANNFNVKIWIRWS